MKNYCSAGGTFVIETSKTLQKRIGWGLLVGLMVYVIPRSVAAAAGKPFWYDELLTVAVSSLGSWKARMTALMLPLDGQPPLFYAIERFASGLTRNQEIALRLPSIAAFLCTLLCVFVYVRKRGGEAIALVCTGGLLLTGLFRTYAVEARPYSMVIACVAFALVCYQRAPSAKWMALMGISLAFAESLHYLAVLAMIPFGLAEGIVFLKTRRIRWLVWAVLVVGIVPLFVQWKLLAINRAYYGPTFWATFSFSNLPRTYAEYFDVHSGIGGGVAALALGVVAFAYWSSRTEHEQGVESCDSAAEATLLMGLLLLPFIGYVLLVVVMHSGFTARYVLATVLGLSLSMGFALARASWKAVVLAAAFIFVAVAVQELSFWGSIRPHIRETSTNAAEVEKFVSKAGHNELPVAVPNNLMYVSFVHYGASSLVNRLQLVIPGSSADLGDTAVKGIVLLKSYWPIQLSTFREFTSKHDEFLVYVEDRDPGRDWFTMRLVGEGWTLKTVALDDFRMVYLVSR